MALQPAAARPAPAMRGFRLPVRPVLGLVAIALVAFALNFTGVFAIPGGPLLAPGASSSGSEGFNGVAMWPGGDHLPGNPWVTSVVLENYGSSDVSLLDASLVDVLTGSDVVGVYVDSGASQRCDVVTFDPTCVSQAVGGGEIGVQTLAPGETTYLMVVVNAGSAYTGFRDVSIRYRSGLLTYTTRLSQGAWACVGVQREACPENPWPTS